MSAENLDQESPMKDSARPKPSAPILRSTKADWVAVGAISAVSAIALAGAFVTAPIRQAELSPPRTRLLTQRPTPPRSPWIPSPRTSPSRFRYPTPQFRDSPAW